MNPAIRLALSDRGESGRARPVVGRVVREGLGTMASFDPPGRDERLRALGTLCDLPRRLRALLRSADDFHPVRPPGHGDWLDLHVVTGQTFEAFADEAGAPAGPGRFLCLLPLAGPSPVPAACLSRFRRFIEAFFMVDVRELPPCRIDDGPVERRSDSEWGLYQWCAADVLTDLVARRTDDALCLLAITTADLYPHALMDYSFGLASRTERVGVCSLARFSPPYCDERSPEDGRLACRGCRLMAHEIGHLLGLQHCVYYACLMNGAATVAEADARPPHLCPIDLRKLQWLMGFDAEERYRRLAALWRELHAEDEAAWVERRLAACRDAASDR